MCPFLCRTDQTMDASFGWRYKRKKTSLPLRHLYTLSDHSSQHLTRCSHRPGLLYGPTECRCSDMQICASELTRFFLRNNLEIVFLPLHMYLCTDSFLRLYSMAGTWTCMHMPFKPSCKEGCKRATKNKVKSQQ